MDTELPISGRVKLDAVPGNSAVSAVILVAISCVLVFAALVDGNPATPTSIFCLICAALFAWAGLRPAYIGSRPVTFVIDDRGIALKQQGKVRFLPWEDLTKARVTRALGLSKQWVSLGLTPDAALRFFDSTYFAPSSLNLGVQWAGDAQLGPSELAKLINGRLLAFRSRLKTAAVPVPEI